MIFHFHAPHKGVHPQRVAGRLQFFAQNTIMGYEIELLDHRWQTFSRCAVSLTDLSSGGRSNKSPPKRSNHRSGFQSLGGILQQPLSCRKEGWGRTTPSKPDSTIMWNISTSKWKT